MKPKLLVFTSTFPRWKNDTDPPFVYELSRRLTDEYDITVHAPHYPGSQTKEIMDGMDIHRFRYFWGSFEKLAGATGILPTLRNNKLYYGIVPFFLLAQFVSLLFLVRKVQPDIVHAHWIIPQGVLAVLVEVMTGVPVIVTAHGADVFGLQSPLFNTIKQFTLKRVKAVTVVSQALADALVGLLSDDIQPEVVSMGVDSLAFSSGREKDIFKKKYGICGPFLLYVGRLTEKKGVRYLIDAIPSVLRDVPAAKLLIVGSGELEEELKHQVLNLGLSNQVHFAGSVPNRKLPVYYATADIFIGPSIVTKSGDTEGFGLTFVEAAMSGCLLIGTNIGGVGDIIKNKETGFVVPEKDSAAIADRIIYALTNDRETIPLKEEARKICIDNFDWQVVVGKYNSILNCLLR